MDAGMNVNNVIKKLKADLQTVKNINKSFKGKQASKLIKEATEDITQLESMRDSMLELFELRDLRPQMITFINYIYNNLADINYQFTLLCDNYMFCDYSEYLSAKYHYQKEENRLKSSLIV
jgi:hypothetical protein